jgi:hypothetical protein
MPGSQRIYSEETVREIQARYDAGESFMTIAPDYGVPHNRMRRTLSAYGFRFRTPRQAAILRAARGRGVGMTGKNKYNMELLHEAGRRVAQGETCVAVGRELGIANLSNILRYRGILPSNGRRKAVGHGSRS